MADKEKPYSDRRFWEPIAFIASGTKKYDSEEEMQKDIETSRQIREYFTRKKREK